MTPPRIYPGIFSSNKFPDLELGVRYPETPFYDISWQVKNAFQIKNTPGTFPSNDQCVGYLKAFVIIALRLH